jgi:hypothetical protein
VMMMVMISSESLSRQGFGTEFLVPNRGFWWWRRSGTLSGKNAEPLIFSSWRVYVSGRGARGDGWGGHTTPWCGLARATRWCGALLAPLRLVLWLRVSSGKIGFYNIFWDFSWKSDFCTKTRHQGNSAENNVSPC